MASTSTPGSSSTARQPRYVKPTGPPTNATLHARTRTIPSGEPLLLRLPSGVHKQVTLKPNTLVSLGKFGCFRGDDLIGLPFGHTYEIVGGTTLGGQGGAKVSRKKHEEVLRINVKRREKGQGPLPVPEIGEGLERAGDLRIVVEGRPAEIEETEATNELFSDLNSAQTLTMLDIHALKHAGVEGRDIIQQASESNATFTQKTAYAQDKYVKRKEQKHLRLFTPLAPTIANIAQHNFDRQPEKVRHMRPDALGLMLSFANVGAGGRYLVVDGVGGALAAAVFERLGGEGRVTMICDTDSTPTLELLPNTNLSSQIIEPVLRSLHWAAIDRNWTPNEVPVDPVTAITTPAGKPLQERDRQRLRKRKALFDEFEAVRQEFFKGDFDGILVATHYEPVSILRRLLPYLAGSGSVAVHSPNLQPLVEAHAVLRLSSDLLNMSITEPWVRKYQVLPGRTHPEMNTSATAGYIFSGIKVFKDDECDALICEGKSESEESKVEQAQVEQEGSSSKRQKLDDGMEATTDAPAPAAADAAVHAAPAAADAVPAAAEV